MRDETFGWNLEMQMRAAAAGLRIIELPVGQRQHMGGVSKVSGNIRVVARAVWVITTTFIRLAMTLRRPHQAEFAIKRGDRTLACERSERFSMQDRVEAEAAARVMHQEHGLGEHQEHILPWPLMGMLVEPQPKVGDEEDADGRHRAHGKTQDEGSAEGKLGQEHKPVNHLDQRQIDVRHKGLVETEGGIVSLSLSTFPRSQYLKPSETGSGNFHNEPWNHM